MTEEEQIAFAMQMSMQEAQDTGSQPTKKEINKEETPMEVDENYHVVFSDPTFLQVNFKLIKLNNRINKIFLQSVLENLPGVDPQSDAVRDAVGSLKKDKKDDKDKTQEK